MYKRRKVLFFGSNLILEFLKGKNNFLKLKIDLHIHTNNSDSTGSVEEILERAELRGLDGIAITDHNTMEGVEEAKKKKTTLIVIPGEEIRTKQGEILSLGIRNYIEDNLELLEVLKRIHVQGGLAIIPHPTVPFFNRVRLRDLEDLPIDGIEIFSAITPFANFFLKRNIRLARNLGLASIAGSDSHFPETVGDAFTIVDSESRNIKDILNAIKECKTEIFGKSSEIKYKLRLIYRLFLKIY